MSLTRLAAGYLLAALTAGQGRATFPPASAGELEAALAETQRALAELRELERRLPVEPEVVLQRLLAATEEPGGDAAARAERLETLRDQVIALHLELEGLRPATGSARPSAATRAESRRALPESRATSSAPPAREPQRSEEPLSPEDPLRRGLAGYRAGRYAEARELLAPLPGARAQYWHARALERLGHLDEAIAVLERAVAEGGEGFERRRAETDLELLRWKRDFVKHLPSGTPAAQPPTPRP